MHPYYMYIARFLARAGRIGINMSNATFAMLRDNA